MFLQGEIVHVDGEQETEPELNLPVKRQRN